MNKEEKEIVIGKIASATVELSDYLAIANDFVTEYCADDNLRRVGLILDKMTEHTDTLKELFENNKIYSLIK